MSAVLYEMMVNHTDAAFISTWQTTAANETITLPLSNKPGSSHNFIVDWGDGNTSSVTSWNDPNATHTYAVPGTYQVKISGTMVGWEFNYAGDCSKILSVDNWGCFRVVPSQEGAFAFCTNLDVLATDIPVLATGRWMFSDCPSLVGNSSFNSWDVSQISDFSYFFYGCQLFNSNTSQWNTSSASNMEGMFQGATSFDQPIGAWNTAAVTNMSYMLQGATSFNQDIGAWNTAAVTTMDSMLSGATSFNQDIGAWNTAAVTNMSRMFHSATAFNQNIGAWNTAAVTSMKAMFFSAATFNQPIGAWNTAAVTDMGNMFQGATSFNQDIGGWNTAAVADMSYMFYAATSFNQDIGAWNTAAVTDMSYMFHTATGFNQNIGAWNTAAVTDMSYTFYDATAFNCGQTSGAVHTLMQRTALGGWRIGGITSANLTHMFSNASSFAGNISSWCADSATTLPLNFATSANANFTVARQPTWGACPIPD